jgi:hypothetical protein
MNLVKRVITAYQKYVDSRVSIFKENPKAVSSGILSLGSELYMHPGITVIYGGESLGKTSVAKRIAIAANAQNLNTIFWDTENKLYLHDLGQLKGITLANATKLQGLKPVISSGLTDMIVVDTLTSMEERTFYIRRLRDMVPYVVLIAQMRDSWSRKRTVPACYEPTLASSHTQIYLTGREKLTIESVDMIRIQYKIGKYEADPKKEGNMDSFVIRDGIVDNLYSAYDYLRSRGRIGSLGYNKTLDGADLGGRFREVSQSPDVAKLILQTVWDDMHKESEKPHIMNISWYR